MTQCMRLRHQAAAPLPEVHEPGFRALRVYSQAHREFKAAQASDLSVLCASATVYGRVNKTADFGNMPFDLWRRAHRRNLPAFVPVYEHPAVRSTSKNLVLQRAQWLNLPSAKLSLATCSVLKC